MGDGEGLEEDARGQSFHVVELCLPPEVPHLLHVDSPRGRRLSPALRSLNLPAGTLWWESSVVQQPVCVFVSPPFLPSFSLPDYGKGEGTCATAPVWQPRGQLSGPGSPFTMVFRKGFPALAVYAIEGSL